MRTECPGCEKCSNFVESSTDKDGGKLFECCDCGYIMRVEPKKKTAKLKESK